MNLSIIPSAFDALRKGEAVADAVQHRNATALGTALGLLLVALVNIAKGLGYDLSFITPDMATQLGLLVAGACTAWGHFATNPAVGILPAKPSAPTADAAPAAGADDAGAPAAARADAQPPVDLRNGGDAAQAPAGLLRG